MNALLDATHAFAQPGSHSIVDMVHPLTGLSVCFNETLEQVRERYPGAELVNFADWLKVKAAEQDAVEAVWLETTKERYWEMLEVLPPAAMAGGAFLLGEPQDHHIASGQPRFSCYRKSKGGDYLVLNKPITHATFREMFTRCPNL